MKLEKLDATVIIPTLGRVERAVALSQKLTTLRPKPSEIYFVFQNPKEFELWNLAHRNVDAIGLLCPKTGAAQARNFGAFTATSQNLVFLDDDCFPTTSEWLEKLIAPLARTEVLMVAGAVHGWHNFSGNWGWTNRAFMLAPPFLTPWGNPASRRSSWCDTVPGGNFAVARQTFLDVGGFSEKFGTPSLFEEMELSLRVLNGRKRRIWFSHEAAVVHIQDEFGGMRAHWQRVSRSFIAHQKKILLESVYGRGLSFGIRNVLYQTLNWAKGKAQR